MESIHQAAAGGKAYATRDDILAGRTAPLLLPRGTYLGLAAAGVDTAWLRKLSWQLAASSGYWFAWGVLRERNWFRKTRWSVYAPTLYARADTVIALHAASTGLVDALARTAPAAVKFDQAGDAVLSFNVQVNKTETGNPPGRIVERRAAARAWIADTLLPLDSRRLMMLARGEPGQRRRRRVP